MKTGENSKYRQNMRYLFASLIVISLLGGIQLVKTNSQEIKGHKSASAGQQNSEFADSGLIFAVTAFLHIETPPLPVLPEVPSEAARNVLPYFPAKKPKKPIMKESAAAEDMAKLPTTNSSIDPRSGLKKKEKAQDSLWSPLGGKTNSVRRCYSPF